MAEMNPNPNAGLGTVFVIDDDEQVRTGLSRLLRSAGWHAEVFASAQTFTERLPYDGVGCVRCARHTTSRSKSRCGHHRSRA